MSKYKTFMDYYNSDPEFKKRHLQKMNEKVECECGFICMKSNLYRHKQGYIHINKMKKINRINQLKEELNKLEKEI